MPMSEEHHIATTERTYWDRHGERIFAAGIGALAVLVIPVVGSWLLGAADAVRDAGRSALFGFEAGQVDDFKELVDDRKYWVTEPTWLGDSLDWVHDHGDLGDPPIALLSGRAATRRPVGRVLDGGASYDGDPFVLVGKVRDDRTRVAGAEPTDHGSTEIVLGAAERSLVVGQGQGYADSGLSAGGFSANEGRTVAFLGVLVALGRMDDGESEAGVDSGYFLALHSATPGPPSVRLGAADSRE
jgi:hypothetical protein